MFLRDGSRDRSGHRERAVGHFVMDAVAGARRTPGRHKTGGIPASHNPSLTVALSVLGLRFAVPHTHRLLRRCGVLGADCCCSGKLSKYDVAVSQCVCSCGADHKQVLQYSKVEMSICCLMSRLVDSAEW